MACIRALPAALVGQIAPGEVGWLASARPAALGGVRLRKRCGWSQLPDAIRAAMRLQAGSRCYIGSISIFLAKT
jgi:hypothetical protein